MLRGATVIDGTGAPAYQADVRISGKLVSAPVFLTSDGEISIEMEKYFMLMKGNDMAQNIHANHVLELNAEHHAFAALKEAYDAGDKDRAARLSKILLAQGILIAGLPLENAAEYADLVCELF